MNYTIFDVETANNQRDSICSIGVIRYENEQVVCEKEILINPEVEFNYFNSKIHGITKADVVDAPTFPEVWNQIKAYFNNTILVAHNAKSMDLCALYRTLERYSLPLVNNDYICTMELAKEIFRNDERVQSYRLDVLSRLYNIDLLHHHNALDDTRACFEILKKFEELYPDVIKKQHYYYGNSCCGVGPSSNISKSFYSDGTKEMQKLQEIVLGIIKDNMISDDEIEQLKIWLEKHDELKGFYPFDKIFEVVESIMLDGVKDPEEEQELLELLDAFINPQTENAEIEFK